MIVAVAVIRLRDLFAVRVPRMAVGMMIAVALYALVSAVVTLAGFGTVDPDPVGWHILVGAAILGFGMVFTGGCASGSLYKAGEGNVGSMLVIVAIFLPPVAVGLKRGIGLALVINIILCLLFVLPGIIHALWVVLT